MHDLLAQRLALLAQPQHSALLRASLHGIERECLRVTEQGLLALTPHPVAFGSALTHPQITTDYSESLLEFITPTTENPADTLADLAAIHRFVYSALLGEYLWSASMPGVLPAEPEIPIAYYGQSNIGRLKTVYRKGLAVRYGKTMQCIAGIHYNFSVAPELWPLLQQAAPSSLNNMEYQSAGYIGLIRNFRRYSWLLMYLFGAAPALDSRFLRGKAHQLEQLDQNTLFLPWATSLRMSDLGYHNNAQASLTPCYNDLSSYTQSLEKAMSTVHPPYAALGVHQGSEWIQLNANILQIENEYYSSIRPKRVALPGERPLAALRNRGVQYIEVRCLDINPFLPLGIELDQAYFLDTFLLLCLLTESPPLEASDCQECTQNFLTVVNEGRRPELLLSAKGQAIARDQWAAQLFIQMAPIADLLDSAHNSTCYSQALAVQERKLNNPELTPSAQVLAALGKNRQSFAEFALAWSRSHAQHFQSTPLPSAQQTQYQRMALDSLSAQSALERADNLDFEDFVQAYQAQSSQKAPT